MTALLVISCVLCFVGKAIDTCDHPVPAAYVAYLTGFAFFVGWILSVVIVESV